MQDDTCIEPQDILAHIAWQILVQLHFPEQSPACLENASCMLVVYPRLFQTEIELCVDRHISCWGFLTLKTFEISPQGEF